MLHEIDPLRFLWVSCSSGGGVEHLLQFFGQILTFRSAEYLRARVPAFGEMVLVDA